VAPNHRSAALFLRSFLFLQAVLCDLEQVACAGFREAKAALDQSTPQLCQRPRSLHRVGLTFFNVGGLL
jgi:hypothetical protein